MGSIWDRWDPCGIGGICVGSEGSVGWDNPSPQAVPCPWGLWAFPGMLLVGVSRCRSQGLEKGRVPNPSQLIRPAGVALGVALRTLCWGNFGLDDLGGFSKEAIPRFHDELAPGCHLCLCPVAWATSRAVLALPCSRIPWEHFVFPLEGEDGIDWDEPRQCWQFLQPGKSWKSSWIRSRFPFGFCPFSAGTWAQLCP